MQEANLNKLEEVKLKLQEISAHETSLLKEYIQQVIRIFNYQDIKIHGHLNELLLTIETDQNADPANFDDILKKLQYLVNLILKEF